MATLQMPRAREFGWRLKETDTSHFQIHEHTNGQFCAVLNHALLRGCSAEMLRWWFGAFTNLRVQLIDTPGYEGVSVPAYLLWHPIDHYNATLLGSLDTDGSPQVGTRIHIQEAMQYDRYGWKYPADAKLTIFYIGPDGWAMGRVLPLLGPVMMLRIHFRDVVEDGQHIGAHYHYEIVIGANANHPLARLINKTISGKFGPEFFAAWRRHNVIEVGTFENFLPVLFKQRADVSALHYSSTMAPDFSAEPQQSAFSSELFQQRIDGYKTAKNSYAYQGYDQPTFI